MQLLKVTPWKLIKLNRLLRLLKIQYSVWKIHNKWFIFLDSKRSRTSEYIYNEIISGFYTPQIELEKLNKGSIILDLGGHVGMFSIPLAKKYPHLLFVCFEANPLTYTNLQHNIHINGVSKNVIAYNIPVGIEGELVIPKSIDKLNSGSSIVEPSTSGKGLASWDWEHIIQHLGKLPSVVKCDIEGSEYKLFQSTEPFNQIEELLIELHPSESRNRLRAWVETNIPFNTIALQGNEPGKTNYRNGEPLG
jgi:FkbM family methyltransferase